MVPNNRLPSRRVAEPDGGAVNAAMLPCLEMAGGFQWDPRKAASNLKRHGVSFQEAISVFSNPLARIFDEDQRTEELREIIIGHSARGRLLLVSFAERDNGVRIISARKATNNERKDYEEGVPT